MTPRPPVDLVQAVRAELATPGCYHLAPPRAVRRSWLEMLFGWLADRYTQFVHALSAHLHVGARGLSLAGDVIIVACVIVLGVVAARLLIALQLERSRASEAVPLGSGRSAFALSQSAAAAAASGEYNRAVRLLFAAAVTLLDLRGVLHDDASATIDELRRELRARNAAADAPFAEIATVYAATAYAERPADSVSWERARARYDELMKAIARA